MGDFARKLSEEELFRCFESLKVPVSLREIKTPTRDFIIRVVEYFLKDLQIDIRSMNLRPFDAMTHLENPEVSEDARTLALLLICINLFSDGVKIGLKDITDPKPKRTKKILNYLIVFWNYALRKFALYESIVEGLNIEKEKVDSLKEENESLLEKYNDCVVALKKLKLAQEELNHRVGLNNERLKDFNKQKEASEIEYQDLKKKEQDLKNQNATAEINLVSVKEAISHLDQCIITSPEQYTDNINKLKDLIKQEDLKIKDKESDLKEKIKSLETLKGSQKENIKTVELLQKVEESYSRLSTIANQAGVTTQKIYQQEKEIEKLEEELRRKTQMKDIYENKAAQVQLNTKKHIDAFVATLEMLQKDISQEQELVENSKISTSELEKKIDLAIDDVVKVVDCIKHAEAETEKAHVAYSAQMEAVSSHFKKDCLDVKEHVKRFFGS